VDVRFAGEDGPSSAKNTGSLSLGRADVNGRGSGVRPAIMKARASAAVAASSPTSWIGGARRHAMASAGGFGRVRAGIGIGILRR